MTFVRRLSCAAATAWEALTDPEQRSIWLGPTTIEPKAGGIITTEPTDPPAPAEAKRMTGRVLVWDPAHVLEHEWNQAIVEPSVVRYELAADEDATMLTFTHRGLSARNTKGFIPGTHAYLDRLAAHLEGTVLPDWAQRYAEVAPEYE